MTPAPPPREDAENWAFYLEEGESLLGVWRPDDTFRVYGMGKAMMYGCWVFAGILIFLPVLMKDYPASTPTLLIGLAIAALGTALGYGPGWLDQRGRQMRRYALSDQRVLEFQDIKLGRLRSVPVDGTLRILKTWNDNLDSFQLSFVTITDQGRAGQSVLFERLTEDQADDVLGMLNREFGIEENDTGTISLRDRPLIPWADPDPDKP